MALVWWRIGVAALAFGAAAVASGCDVYDTSLLGDSAGGGGSNPDGGNGTGGTPTTGGGGQGGEGGTVACQTPDQCPGMDTECGVRTCDDGTCGIDAAAEGTPATDQMDGDCIHRECDGLGAIVGIPDDADVDNDNNDCTNDDCDGGIPSHTPKAAGVDCTGTAPAKVCNGDTVAPACVECVDGGDCLISGSCTAEFECEAASCNDALINNGETDLNCGGPNCDGCPIGDMCDVDSDCLGNNCNGTTCQPSCEDLIQNQGETDLDCGGPNCPPCLFGEDCVSDTDCETGNCGGSDTCTCAANNGVLIISEVMTRGLGGGTDEFVELYNPGTVAVPLSSSWVLKSRSSAAGSYSNRWVGSSGSVPAGGHFLIVGAAHTGVAGDATLITGVGDEGSLTLENGATLVDAVCFRCGTTSLAGYTCEGTPAQKTVCTNNVDKSIERKPGGLQGNCIDTASNLDDFAEIVPSNPQNLASPAVP